MAPADIGKLLGYTDPLRSLPWYLREDKHRLGRAYRKANPLERYCEAFIDHEQAEAIEKREGAFVISVPIPLPPQMVAELNEQDEAGSDAKPKVETRLPPGSPWPALISTRKYPYVQLGMRCSFVFDVPLVLDELRQTYCRWYPGGGETQLAAEEHMAA